MKILVTGAAGFIGFFTARRLLERGDYVVGVDNFNDYYDVSLKEARVEILGGYDNFTQVRQDLADREGMEVLFASQVFDKVVHLAAQTGVRYSVENPYAYVDDNIVSTLNVLEGCRSNKVEHLVYASSSKRLNWPALSMNLWWLPAIVICGCVLAGFGPTISFAFRKF